MKIAMSIIQLRECSSLKFVQLKLSYTRSIGQIFDYITDFLNTTRGNLCYNRCYPK